MSEDKLGLFIVVIVAVVAVVSLFLLNSDGSTFFSDDASEDSALTGQGAGGRFGGLFGESSGYTKTTTTSSSRSCTDSDGGFEPRIYGVTTGYLSGTYATKKDVCIDDGTLKEYTCKRNKIRTRSVDCSLISICEYGACTVIAEYSTFDDDNDGWTVDGDPDPDASRDDSGRITPEYDDEERYIYVEDAVTGGTMYWVAPEKYLGEKSLFLGRYLNFDLKLSDYIGFHFAAVDVILVSTGGEILVYFDQENYLDSKPETDWISYSIKLDSTSGWKDATGISLFTSELLLTQYADELSSATDSEIEGVLGSLAAVYIRGEFIHGDEIIHMDNVAFGIRS